MCIWSHWEKYVQSSIEWFYKSKIKQDWFLLPDRCSQNTPLITLSNSHGFCRHVVWAQLTWILCSWPNEVETKGFFRLFLFLLHSFLVERSQLPAVVGLKSSFLWWLFLKSVLWCVLINSSLTEPSSHQFLTHPTSPALATKICVLQKYLWSQICVIHVFWDTCPSTTVWSPY